MGTTAWRALGHARPSPHRLLREISNARFLSLLLGCVALLLLAGSALPAPGSGGHAVPGHRGTRVISKTVDSTRDASVYTELIIDSRGGTTRVTRDRGGAVQVTLTDGAEGETGRAVGGGFASAATAVNQALADRDGFAGLGSADAGFGSTVVARSALGEGRGAQDVGAASFGTASGLGSPASPASAVSKALVAARAEIARRFPDLPEDFDPDTYLSYYPELRAEGVRSPDDARQHYLSRGRAEGRLGAPLRVILRYTACTGLINQHYSHIAALTLAAELGAEVVLPPAACRDSFGHYFSTFREKNEVVWSPAPLETLLDVDYLAKYWAERGMEVRLAPALTPFPDLTAPEQAFPAYAEPGVDPDAVVRLENVYARNMEIKELVDMARTAVLDRAHALARQALAEGGSDGGAAHGARAGALGARALAQARETRHGGVSAREHAARSLLQSDEVDATPSPGGGISTRRRLQSLVEDDIDELFSLEASLHAGRELQVASRKLDAGHRQHSEPRTDAKAATAEGKSAAVESTVATAASGVANAKNASKPEAGAREEEKTGKRSLG